MKLTSEFALKLLLLTELLDIPWTTILASTTVASRLHNLLPVIPTGTGK